MRRRLRAASLSNCPIDPFRCRFDRIGESFAACLRTSNRTGAVVADRHCQDGLARAQPKLGGPIVRVKNTGQTVLDYCWRLRSRIATRARGVILRGVLTRGIRLIQTKVASEWR